MSLPKKCVMCFQVLAGEICLRCQKLQLSCITDRLFLADYRNAKDYQLLKSKGIRQILVVGRGMLHHTEDFKIKYISVDDDPEEWIYEYFDAAHQFMDQDSTVVHCLAGISRSPTIVNS